MIKKPFIYSQADQLLISQKEASTQFNHESWSDNDISELKNRIKKHYIKIQKNTCPYCRQSLRSNNGRVWDIEHIIPRIISIHFMFTPENLCISCIECNGKKHENDVRTGKGIKRLPKKSKGYKIIHPHFDNYTKHILLIKAGFFYIARTDKGEFTIETCGLNRFHEFANMEEPIGATEQIIALAQAANNETNESKKIELNRKIAELALNNLCFLTQQ